jgi:hypothetical protein
MPARDAIRSEILRLADRDLDRYDFVREGARVLRRAVPFDAMAGVWFDPESGLPVDEWIDNSLAGGAGSRLPEIGLHDIDIAAFRQLAASGRYRDHARAGARPRAHRVLRGGLRPHRARTARVQARRAGPAQRRHRRPALRVDLHGPGPPQGDLREARCLQPRTARRQAVPRSLRAVGGRLTERATNDYARIQRTTPVVSRARPPRHG